MSLGVRSLRQCADSTAAKPACGCPGKKPNYVGIKRFRESMRECSAYVKCRREKETTMLTRAIAYEILTRRT